MKLVVVSYKECWSDPASPSGYATVGGFAYQMQALSQLFSATSLMLPLYQSPLPSGAIPLTGKHLSVNPLPAPVGSDLRRKLALFTWLPRNIGKIWQQIRQADVVHAPVPGDIGLLGLMIALIQRKPLFVRHCGTWDDTSTLANRFIAWLLPRIANQHNIVLATGGGETPPSPENLDVHWIFSTTLAESEIEALPPPRAWHLDEPLQLVTVGRLTVGKNVKAIIEALPSILRTYPDTQLQVVGDGPEKANLELLTQQLQVSNQVIFHGNVDRDRVMDIIQQSHLFVFPTRVAEGFPKAVLEALACGRPVIAPRVSILPYLLRNDSGYILESTDSRTVSDAVHHVLADVENFNRMMHKAQTVSKQYTLEEWGAQIRRYLEAAWGTLDNQNTH